MCGMQDMYVENEMTTETDKVYQRLVKEAEGFCNIIEGQDLDARCVSKDDPQALGKLARRLQDKHECAMSRLKDIEGKLARDYNVAAGMTFWQLGYIGEILFPIDGSPGLIDDKVKVGEWLKTHGLKRQRFQDARHARKRFKIQEARKFGYRKMMEIMADEKQLQSDNEDDKGGTGRKKTSNKGRKEWALRGDLCQSLERNVSKLSTIRDTLPKAPDLSSESDDERSKNYAAIIAARALLKSAHELHFKVQDELDKAEELNPHEDGGDCEKAKLTRDELRIYKVRGGEDHAEKEVSTALPLAS